MEQFYCPGRRNTSITAGYYDSRRNYVDVLMRSFGVNQCPMCYSLVFRILVFEQFFAIVVIGLIGTKLTRLILFFMDKSQLY